MLRLLTMMATSLSPPSTDWPPRDPIMPTTSPASAIRMAARGVCLTVFMESGGGREGALAPLFPRRSSNWRDIVLRILGDCARCMEQAWRTDGELRTLPLTLVESFVRKPLPPLPSGKLPDLAPIMLLPPSR